MTVTMRVLASVLSLAIITPVAFAEPIQKNDNENSTRTACILSYPFCVSKTHLATAATLVAVLAAIAFFSYSGGAAAAQVVEGVINNGNFGGGGGGGGGGGLSGEAALAAGAAVESLVLCSRPTLSHPLLAGRMEPQTEIWVTYNQRLGGEGDKVMAERVAQRLLTLGYRILVISHVELKSRLAANPAEGLPEVIINVPDNETPILSPPALYIPMITLQEAGYVPEATSPALGFARDSEGMLFDPELMTWYTECARQEDPLRFKLKGYENLTPEIKRLLNSQLGLNDESTPEQIESALRDVDIYIGYAHSEQSTSAFVQRVQALANLSKRRSFIFLPMDFANNFRSQGLVHLVTPGRLARSDFKALMFMSDYALVTGDRSLEEAISAGVPFYYEKLFHKEKLRNQLEDLVREFAADDKIHLERPRENISSRYANDTIAFFRRLHAMHYFDDAKLLKILKLATDFRGEPFSDDLRTFELGTLYALTLDQISSLTLGHDGQVVDENQVARYKLSRDHKFEFMQRNNLYYVKLLRQ